jgi:hypothetical protein
MAPIYPWLKKSSTTGDVYPPPSNPFVLEANPGDDGGGGLVPGGNDGPVRGGPARPPIRMDEGSPAPEGGGPGIFDFGGGMRERRRTRLGGGQPSGPVPGPDLTPPPGYEDLAPEILERVRALLAAGSRFTPEVMEGIKESMLEASEGRRKAAGQQTRDAAAASGNLRAGATTAALGNQAAQFGQEYTQGSQDLEIEKAKTDFEDKVTAISVAQRDLENARNHVLSQNMQQIERDRLMSSIALAEARLEFDRESLEYDRWKFMMNREPIEGRDFIWTIGPDGQRHRVFLAALQAGGNLIS